MTVPLVKFITTALRSTAHLSLQVWPGNAPDDISLVDAETQARRLKKGLWSGSHKIIAPWNWQKMSKDERDLYR